MRFTALALLALSMACGAQSVSQSPASPAAQPGTTDAAAAALRGGYGPFRSNNDLLSYTLDIRVDPVAKSIRGSNLVRFRMLATGSRIQMELTPVLSIERVKMKRKELRFTREGTTFFIDFPKELKRGKTYEVQIFYAGEPKRVGRFGGMVFDTDSKGRPWIFTSCEDEGASVWWPNKDQWRDEPQEGVTLRVAVPNGLMDVSNGRLKGKKDLHDGFTRWDWRVTYPINNYDVALNIGAYEYFDDRLNDLTLDFYALPEDLAKARVQFAQAKPMLSIYQRYFGDYPFARDGYKLVQVPYAGMEHQSAVAYGNGFHNSYGKGDWTGVGISPRFDFIIIHESAHEWFGNSVSAADPADMWIQEAFTTYAEDVYVEAMYGHDDAIRYVNGLRPKVKGLHPILQTRGLAQQPPDADQYFKGALFLNTLRSVVDDDAKWFATLHAFAGHFRYQNILTEDVVAFFNQLLAADYTAIFDQYLRYTALPKLELHFSDAAGTVRYRWVADVRGFAMPVRAGNPERWTTLHPTSEWQTVPGKRNSFKIDADHFYVEVLER